MRCIFLSRSPKTECGAKRIRARAVTRAVSAVLLSFWVVAAAAQPITLNGPVEGFVFDVPTASFRAIAGVPGSATFGPSILSGLDFGSVSPHQNYAIAFQSGNCRLVTGLDSSAASTAAISGVPGTPDGIVWSADGSLAVLYSHSGNWIQTISSLPGSPVAGTYMDVSSLGGSLSAVSADAHGRNIAVAMSGTNGSVYLLSDSQSFVPVLSLMNVAALSFSADGASLYVLDTSVPQLSQLDLNSLTAQNLPLDGLAQPLAVLPDPARQVIYVASGNDQLLRIIDLATQQVVSDISLSVAPGGIDALGRASFVVASRSQGAQPLWLFTTNPQPATYFVPAIYAAAGGLQ